MAMIALRQLLDHAAEHDYGVPAFNINNMEQIQAIMLAAEATANSSAKAASSSSDLATPCSSVARRSTAPASERSRSAISSAPPTADS